MQPMTAPVAEAIAAEAECVPGRYLLTDGVALPLAGRVTRLGRGVSADVRLDDATVSRRHARIHQDGERAAIVEEHSLHGVWVNGRRVARAVLRDGDVIRLGQVLLRYVEVV